MYVNCHTCPQAGNACPTCVVGFFIDQAAVAPLDQREAAAVDMLVGLGMVDPAEARHAHARREPLSLVS